MRQQRIERTTPKPQTTVVRAQPRPAGNTPVRTVMYVEVGGMSTEQVQELARQFAQNYDAPVYGPHYFIPVRNGKIRTDVQFEQEFLTVARELCEVRDGEIQLRNGATDVVVSRVNVDGSSD